MSDCSVSECEVSTSLEVETSCTDAQAMLLDSYTSDTFQSCTSSAGRGSQCQHTSLSSHSESSRHACLSSATSPPPSEDGSSLNLLWTEEIPAMAESTLPSLHLQAAEHVTSSALPSAMNESHSSAFGSLVESKVDGEMGKYCRQKIEVLRKLTFLDTKLHREPDQPEGPGPTSNPDQVAFCASCIRRLSPKPDDALSGAQARESLEPTHIIQPPVTDRIVHQMERLKVEAILHKLRSQVDAMD